MKPEFDSSWISRYKILESDPIFTWHISDNDGIRTISYLLIGWKALTSDGRPYALGSVWDGKRGRSSVYGRPLTPRGTSNWRSRTLRKGRKNEQGQLRFRETAQP
jgi:hypothetical protein